MRPPLWLFDLDNTLHDASSHIFPYINQAMTAYVARQLQINSEQASQVRDSYWRRYGATLLGLVRHHQVNPHEFLKDTHRFDERTGQHLGDLADVVRGEKSLRKTLNRLPGRKILLTNAPRSYALKVMKELGLEKCFFAIEAVENMRVHNRWRPKPDQLMLRRVLKKYRAAPKRAVLVDDTLGHLLEYSKLGIRTVWFKRYIKAFTHKRSCISLEVQSINQLSKHWQRFA